jgi:hypothetical protein
VLNGVMVLWFLLTAGAILFVATGSAAIPLCNVAYGSLADKPLPGLCPPMSAFTPIATRNGASRRMTLCANRVIRCDAEYGGLSAVSDKPPYGTSMPGLGAVHHINKRYHAL